MRTTLTYALNPELRLGVEYNPLADDVGVLANWRAVKETENTPALMFGTSSDRIGTDSGRSYYGTLSKDLEHAIGLPIAPYAGLSYGEADDELVGIGGLSIRWSDKVSSVHLWDGHNLHHVLERSFERSSLGLVVVDLDGSFYVGLSWNISFAGP
ncbi:MAG: hypothetical protein JNL28_06020 [Planctomycetes bacterium]|nr:hypothetical protein [Planctomycetota bacterium]